MLLRLRLMLLRLQLMLLVLMLLLQLLLFLHHLLLLVVCRLRLLGPRLLQSDQRQVHRLHLLAHTNAHTNSGVLVFRLDAHVVLGVPQCSIANLLLLLLLRLHLCYRYWLTRRMR